MLLAPLIVDFVYECFLFSDVAFLISRGLEALENLLYLCPAILKRGGAQ